MCFGEGNPESESDAVLISYLALCFKMEGDNQKLCYFCPVFQGEIMAVKIQGVTEVFVRVGTSLLGELKHPFLMKVAVVVISGNVLIQTETTKCGYAFTVYYLPVPLFNRGMLCVTCLIFTQMIPHLLFEVRVNLSGEHP